MSQYRAEKPKIQLDENDPHYSTLQEIFAWLDEPVRQDHSWVAGIFGGRGTGKTSLMLSLLSKLQDHTKNFSIPKVDEDRPIHVWEESLFSPARTRDHDDLLFLLLDYLERSYRIEGAENFDPCREIDRDEHRELGRLKDSPFYLARLAEVRRRNVKLFLDYDKEVSPSTRLLPYRFVQTSACQAATTSLLQQEFDKIIQLIKLENTPRNQTNSERKIVLLVDDIDLQPHRGLELLELVDLFMNRPGVIVIIAADYDLLLSSIDADLTRRRINQLGLASAFLTKLVPVQFHLPTLSTEQRFEHLWPVEQAEQTEAPIVKVWWPETTQNVAEVIELRQRMKRQNKLGDPNDSQKQNRSMEELELPSQRTDTRSYAQERLQSTLPPAFRSLNAAHNAMCSLIDRCQFDPVTRPMAWIDWLNKHYSALHLDRTLLPGFLCQILVFDARWPYLGMRDAIEQSPEEMCELFNDLAKKDKEERNEIIEHLRSTDAELIEDAIYDISDTMEVVFSKNNQPSDRPVEDRIREPWVSGREIRKAKSVLRDLALTWSRLRDQSSQILQNVIVFFAISLNGDAKESSQSLWKDRIEKDRIYHLDLRELEVFGTRAGEKTLGRAKKQALDYFRSSGILAFRGQLELHARAQLPLMVWLGWQLRFFSNVVAYNFFRGNLVPFIGPGGPIPFPDRRLALGTGSFAVFEPDWLPVDEKAPVEAVIIIDLLRRSTKEQLELFKWKNGRPVQAGFRLRLLFPEGRTLTQTDVVPVLEDILEALGNLRHHRGVERFHLGIAAPDVFAFFLGQQLNALGQISLYEHYTDEQGERYMYVFDLSEEASD